VVKAQRNSVLWDFISLGCSVLCLLGLFCGFWVYFSFLFFLVLCFSSYFFIKCAFSRALATLGGGFITINLSFFFFFFFFFSRSLVC
jgi:hypothetical protein